MTSTTDIAADSLRRLVIQVVGEIDGTTAPFLRRVLARVAPGSRGQVVVDLSGVTFMDAPGLQPLIEAKARLGDRMWLSDVPPRVTDLLRDTGVHADFGIQDAGDVAPTVAASHGLRELEERLIAERARASSRARVDQAKGLVMATRRCGAKDALQMIRQASREHGVDVHDVVDALTIDAAARATSRPGAAVMAALRTVLAVAPEPLDGVSARDAVPGTR